MRKIILIAGIALISSCSVFKKNEKSITKSKTSLEQGSAQTSIEGDTSKRKSTSRLRMWFTPVPVTTPNLDGYSAPAFPNLGTGALKNDVKNLQKQTQKLASVFPVDTTRVFNRGYQLAVLELEGTFDEQLGKFKAEAKRDTSTRKEEISDKEIKKEPDRVIIIAGFIIIALLIFLKK